MVKGKETAEYALDYALRQGADFARVCYGYGCEASCLVRDNVIDNVFSSGSSSIVVMLSRDGRYGEFSSNLLDCGQIEALIDRALESVALIEADPCHSLPEKRLYYKGPSPDLGQFDPSLEDRNPAYRRNMAISASKEIYGTDSRIISVEAEYADASYYNYMTDSQGFEGEESQTSHVLSVSCTVKGGGDSRPEGYWFESSQRLDTLKAEGCGRKALKRALDSIDPTPLESGRYSIVVENTAAAKLLTPLITAVSGPALQQKSSFLLDSFGRKVFSDRLTLIDDPHLYGAIGARWFDSDGIATRRTAVIEDGVLKHGYVSNYYALKMGMEPTADGISVACLKPGGSGLSLEEILRLTGRGILVTGFNGGNQNIATGDFSYGIQGFLFEDGVKVRPVSEMNITGNLRELWNNVTAIGDDPATKSKWRTPTLAFSDVLASGV